MMKKTKYYRPFTGSKRYENDTVCCPDIRAHTWGGGLENLLGLIYIPNIRSYVLLNNPVYKSGHEFLDYCPFCGDKFPKRLDEKLTKILQKEYDLTSWEDFKKAPHEFHTDEWWKKRGL